MSQSAMVQLMTASDASTERQTQPIYCRRFYEQVEPLPFLSLQAAAFPGGGILY